VSRSRLFRLQPLEADELGQLLERALADPERGYGDRPVALEPAAAAHLLDVASGDARSLLNALELAVETTEPGADGLIRIDLSIAEESIQQRAVLYDKQGDAHFDTISAFIKSLRGSDSDAALFWLARMVEAGENPRFIFRRMLIAAGEDVGLADPQAIVVVEACAAAFERVGCRGAYPLPRRPSISLVPRKATACWAFSMPSKLFVPPASRPFPPTCATPIAMARPSVMARATATPHAYSEHWVAQTYLPAPLQGQVFWQPGSLGWEGAIGARLRLRRAAQLAAEAESSAEQIEIVSSSEADPLLRRWLQRQAVAEGERLDRLRQRFWQGASWQRHDRVLVLEARSLLLGPSPPSAPPLKGAW